MKSISGVILVGTGALALLLISMHKEKNDPYFKNKRPEAWVLFVRCLHYAIVIFITMYVFLFDEDLDFFYLAFTGLVIVHWFFNKAECVFSVIEKRYYKKDYIAGSIPSSVFLYLVFGELCGIASKIIMVLNVLNIVLVMYRVNLEASTKILVSTGILIGLVGTLALQRWNGM